jgi:hypothetical protein
MDNVNIGDAVTVSSSRFVGLVHNVDRGRALAWVNWPDNCGMPDVVALGILIVVQRREYILQALQALQPAIGYDPFSLALQERRQNAVVVIDQPRTPNYLRGGR